MTNDGRDYTDLQKRTAEFFAGEMVSYNFYHGQILYTKWYPIKDPKTIPELMGVPNVEIRAGWIRGWRTLRNIKNKD